MLDEPYLDLQLQAAVARLGGDRFAVRSSGAAEDLPDASYAGLYETYLNVPAEQLGAAVRRCFAAAASERVAAYHERHCSVSAGMAVLVQVMVDPIAAGVAFTAHPVTGDRSQTVVAAVPGLGDRLVSGETTGEEWIVTADQGAALTRHSSDGRPVVTARQAEAVARLAMRVVDRFGGQPQDIEWAIDHQRQLWLLQARPMTAVPEPVSWKAPGPGLWMRNFRLGEWLPEAVTPWFATWLLPVLEDGFLDGMQATVGVRVPFRYALVNGWYYNAPPIPSPKIIARVLWQGRGRAVKIIYNALIRVSRDPAGADKAVLSDLDRQWRQVQLPRYRRLVATAAAEVHTAAPHRLVELIDILGREAGIFLWYLAVVGGSAWKMEARLTRFARRHLAGVLPEQEGGAQVLLRGLPQVQLMVSEHAVQSLDWWHPLAADLPNPASSSAAAADRRVALAEERAAAERRCRAALVGRPQLLEMFRRLLEVSQRYAIIREEQAREFTLAWPVLRACAARLGQHLVDLGAIQRADDVYFCTHDQVTSALAGQISGQMAGIGERLEVWQRQRQLAAPLTPPGSADRRCHRPHGAASPQRRRSRKGGDDRASRVHRTRHRSRPHRPRAAGLRGLHRWRRAGSQDHRPRLDAAVLPRRRRGNRQRQPGRTRLPGSARVRNPSRRRHRRRHPPIANRPDDHRRRHSRHRHASRLGMSASHILKYRFGLPGAPATDPREHYDHDHEIDESASALRPLVLT
jgi:rifampicin phosphotransferase